MTLSASISNARAFFSRAWDRTVLSLSLPLTFCPLPQSLHCRVQRSMNDFENWPNG